MKKSIGLTSLLLVAILSGCASSGGYSRYSGGSNYGSRYSQGREVLPGMNARETGAVVGGVAGAALGQGFSGPVQALTIVGGMVAGGLFGDQYDEAARQAGRTNCTWRYFGSVDPSGIPHQSTGYYDCSGGNSTVGNRNYPPIARPQ